MAGDRWERGDVAGHDFPVDLDALRSGGPAFLTGAFHATGAMDAGNRVVAITRLEPSSGGSTGRKAVLSVAYAHAERGLPEHLFVKFSRDRDDARRDHGRWQMESEVRFGLLSTIPDFPVAVPRCLFGDFNVESGSGVLITERIAFGTDGVEPHRPKARDHEIDDVVSHYEALVSAMARLAGSHRAGRLPDEVMAHFPARSSDRSSSGHASYTPDKLEGRIARYADFAARFPQVLPESIRSERFIAALAVEGRRAVDHVEAIRVARRDGYRKLFAFCHWNANIDNAWFWRDDRGGLECGLMDWGNVGQINMANALTSCLMFSEPDFFIENLDHLLDVFTAVFEDVGGGPLDPADLKLQIALNLVVDGLRLPLDRVSLIERAVPDLASVEGRFDTRIADDEFARTQLHILTWALVRWRELDIDGLIDCAIGATS